MNQSYYTHITKSTFFSKLLWPPSTFDELYNFLHLYCGHNFFETSFLKNVCNNRNMNDIQLDALFILILAMDDYYNKIVISLSNLAKNNISILSNLSTTDKILNDAFFERIIIY
jgi:hypothetical protein